MRLATQEAARFNHDYIGTEHILLGLVKEGNGVAAIVLKNLAVDLRRIRLEVEMRVECGPDMVTKGKVPQAPRAKKVIEYAMHEARILNDNYVGTEHILLGLLRDDDGFAANVLMNLGLRLEQVRTEMAAIPERADKEGGNSYPPQFQIAASESRAHPLDHETKQRVRQLADALRPLQEAKENAVAVQDFQQAAQLRDRQDEIWKELRSLNLPEWVFKNVKRLVNAWSVDFKSPYSLDRYYDEPGTD